MEIQNHLQSMAMDLVMDDHNNKSFVGVVFSAQLELPYCRSSFVYVTMLRLFRPHRACMILQDVGVLIPRAIQCATSCAAPKARCYGATLFVTRSSSFFSPAEHGAGVDTPSPPGSHFEFALLLLIGLFLVRPLTSSRSIHHEGR